ncbi:unnamed protein product [Rodentolepis nana]|uniref:NR LBD domain-containing protein n=1 Tax=Rodentolepis nana TaxID=102285 RepID=A0A0R3TZQ9_RODNA|nr:unnamed protein product [Rodentolepis nana]
MEPNEKTSLYRMIQGTQVPGKIVFVDNNFERQNMTEGPISETLALSPIVENKRNAATMQEYSLRRGMSASTAVLPNLESVYITGPGGPEDPMGTTEYNEMVTRSAFNFPQSVSQGAEVPQPMFGTLVGPKGATKTINLNQHGDYDSATFQRRCTSMKSNPGFVPNPYRYIHQPYVYTPIVGSSPSHVIQYRGIPDANNAEGTPYSPHTVQHRQPYVFADERHTYHDLDILAATLQRQRRPVEHFVEIAPPQNISSAPYGRLRQPMSSYTIATPNNRYATLNTRMAPDGEVTSMMEPLGMMKRVRVPIVERDDSGTLNEGESEDFDRQDSPNSLSEAFVEEDFEEENRSREEEEPESITDPNAKLIVSEDEQTLKRICEAKQLQSPPSHHQESESQATEEILVASGHPSSTNEESQQTPQPSQLPLTYTVHEASFLTCLRLIEGVSSSALVPYAASLAQLCIALLTFDESDILSMTVDSEESEGVPVAPPYLFHSTDPPARLEYLLSLLAHWLSRRILLLASEQPDNDFEKLLKCARRKTWNGQIMIPNLLTY